MTIERFMLIAGASLSLTSILYIPKAQLRKALLTFLSFQATTWFVSILLVQFNAISFPVREFTKATNVVFIPQFFIYPTCFTWFIFLFSQKNSIIYKILHWIISVSLPVWLAYFIAVYTDLSEFTKGSWLKNLGYLYFELTLQYLICFIYIKWFYRFNKAGEKQINVF
ncbi:MAG: hypothetical protein K0S75_1136 [Clostridia bacterium]|jgi:hypothetical protein|nr:hypothetical protein [Clostridia bacterium]